MARVRGTTTTRVGGWAIALALAVAPAARAQTEGGASEEASGAVPSDATPTDATPTGATPSDVTPADAHPGPPTGESPPGDAQPRDATPADPSEAEPLTGAPPESGAPAAPPWRWPGLMVWSIALRLGVPPQSSFDRALVSHGYGDVHLVPALVTGFAIPAGVEWLWLGGQLGVRGRTWAHAEHEDASMVAVDLLAVARLRFLLGDRVELGVAVGGGVGWVGVWVNGVAADSAVGRFDVRGELAFRVGRHFAFGPHVGWDYFQLEGIGARPSTADAGGPYFGLTLEGRE